MRQVVLELSRVKKNESITVVGDIITAGTK